MEKLTRMETEEKEAKTQAASQLADCDRLTDLPVASDLQAKIKGGARGWRSTGPIIFGPISLPVPKNNND